MPYHHGTHTVSLANLELKRDNDLEEYFHGIRSLDPDDSSYILSEQLDSLNISTPTFYSPVFGDNDDHLFGPVSIVLEKTAPEEHVPISNNIFNDDALVVLSHTPSPIVNLEDKIASRSKHSSSNNKSIEHHSMYLPTPDPVTSINQHQPFLAVLHPGLYNNQLINLGCRKPVFPVFPSKLSSTEKAKQKLNVTGYNHVFSSFNALLDDIIFDQTILAFGHNHINEDNDFPEDKNLVEIPTSQQLSTTPNRSS